MTSKELLDAGELALAISKTGEELRNNPTNQSQRIFLFELLCCAGDLDRAAKQLAVLAAENAETAIAIQSYQNALEGEKKRRLVFAEGRQPKLPERVPPYVTLHLDAVAAIREGRYQDARVLLEQAEELRPAIAGDLNGESFEDLKDADDLIGPFLEVIAAGNYSWIPWEMIRSVSIAPPEHLRDLIWIPARVELDTGPSGEVFIPVLYPGSYLQEDRVKLGRTTDWRSDVAGLALGHGQRMVMADDKEWPLLEIRTITLAAPDGDYGTTGA